MTNSGTVTPESTLFLSKVAFRILAAPPSSATSKRNVSEVALILTSFPNLTGCELVTHLIQLRAEFYDNGYL